MGEKPVTASVMLHGFPDLGLGGGSRPTFNLELAAEGLCGRAVLRALLERFTAPLEPVLGRAREPGCRLKNVFVFANDIAIDDVDEPLSSRVDAEGRIGILLILAKAIAGG